MINCSECVERLYPDDPRVDGGCRYWCDKPEYYRQLENQPGAEQVIVHRLSDMSKQDWDLLQQTARRVKFLEEKITELRIEKKKTDYY